MRVLFSGFFLGAVVVTAASCAKGTATEQPSGSSSEGSGGTGAGGAGQGGQAGAAMSSSSGSGGATSGSGTGGSGGTGGSTASSGTGGSTASSGTGGAGGGAGGASNCGNAMVDPGEDCDGDNNGKTCVDLGYMNGQLSCTAQCTFDTSGCDTCGNGIIQPQYGEQCDFDSMGNPLILATCAGLGFPNSTANPDCDPQCHFDTRPCRCGDGITQAPEQCDGNDLSGQTCATLGYTAGTLACLTSCDFDTSGCTVCGNQMVEPGETCDDGNTTSGDGCSATCQTEVMACDPDGVYMVIQGGPIMYTCCLGLVSVNVSSFILSANGASILSSPSSPVTMTGNATTCPTGSFSNSGTLPGGCAETYSVTGSFTGPDTWTGTYMMTFTGPDCTCFGLGTPCINQVYPITAMR